MKNRIKLTALWVVAILTTATYVFAAPTAATFDITSTSQANTGLTSASVSVSGTKAATLISYTVTATATGQTTQKVTVTPPASATQWLVPVSGLAGGVEYSFVVTTTDSSGSTNSSPQNFTPKSIPVAVTTQDSTVGAGQVTLNWLPPANVGGAPITGYTISESGKTWPADKDAKSLIISNLSPGGGYTFSIVATNTIGNSASASFQKVTIPTAPDAPAAPTLALDGVNVIATWNAPANDGGSTVTSYLVTLTPTSGAALTMQVQGTRTATFMNVAAGTYTATVVASNKFYTGVASASSIALLTTGVSASPSPSASASASPSPSSSASQTSAPSQPIPAPVAPVIAPSPLPTIIATPTAKPEEGKPTIAPVPAAAPTPVLTVAPIPSSTPSQVPAAPTEIKLPSGTVSASSVKPSVTVVVKSNSYVSVASAKVVTSPVTLKTSTSTQTIIPGRAVAISIPSVAKGTVVTTTMKTPDGKTVVLASGKTSKAGTYSLPALKLSKPGTYSIVVKIGGVIKTLKVVVKK